jgi:hypothetical protein
MSWFMVDVEADGPCPGLYSMFSFGAVLVEPGLSVTYYGECQPISNDYDPNALLVTKTTREDTLKFPLASTTMSNFAAWIESVNAPKTKPRFISDNNGFDWQFINYYFHRFCKKNPFGHSSTNLGSLYKGIIRDSTKTFKHLRTTRHNHDPVDDARGNAEALMYMIDKMRLHFPL